jgi:hypothetical protein
MATASRGTGPEHSAKWHPGPTSPRCTPYKPSWRVHTRHSREAIREPKNHAARRRACRTGRKGASIQPSMAKSCLLRIPGLRGPGQALPQAQLSSWALLTSSLPTRPDTAKSRKTVGRVIQNDLALACGGFAVHWPLLRLYRRKLGTSRFPHTCRTEMPSDTPFLFVVQSHRWSSFRQPSPGLLMASLAKRSCASTNPAQPLAPAKRAVWLCLVHGPEPGSLNLAGAVAFGTLPGASAFLTS